MALTSPFLTMTSMSLVLVEWLFSIDRFVIEVKRFKFSFRQGGDTNVAERTFLCMNPVSSERRQQNEDFWVCHQRILAQPALPLVGHRYSPQGEGDETQMQQNQKNPKLNDMPSDDSVWFMTLSNGVITKIGETLKPCTEFLSRLRERYSPSPTRSVSWSGSLSMKSSPKVSCSCEVLPYLIGWSVPEAQWDPTFCCNIDPPSSPADCSASYWAAQQVKCHGEIWDLLLLQKDGWNHVFTSVLVTCRSECQMWCLCACLLVTVKLLGYFWSLLSNCVPPYSWLFLMKFTSIDVWVRNSSWPCDTMTSLKFRKLSSKQHRKIATEFHVWMNDTRLEMTLHQMLFFYSKLKCAKC